MREIQAKRRSLAGNENGSTGTGPARVGLGEVGHFDQDIYGGSNKLDGYVTSIAANEEPDEDEETGGGTGTVFGASRNSAPKTGYQISYLKEAVDKVSYSTFLTVVI